MTRIACAAAFAIACGGDDATDAGADGAADVANDAGAEADAIELVDGPNVMPVIVNQGLAGSGSVDEPFVSVTICAPGTSQCQTIDDVLVDTGSTGLRIMSSALTSVTLPTQAIAGADGGASALAECEIFGDAYQWGSVRLADVKLGGEVASSLPVHVVGDPAYANVPSDCSSLGSPQVTPAELGANGLLGISTFVYDCGPACAGANPLSAFYYSCDATTCTVASAALAQQLTNPIAALPTDNNGASLRFPSVPPEGAATLAGQIVFGIGTQSNNALGGATVIDVDGNGNFTTIFDGQTLTQSFIDTGTNELAFPDGTIPRCSAPLDYLFCPPQALAFTAQDKGTGGATTTVTFDVQNAATLFANASFTAFDGLAGPGATGTFVWGFPFFIGRVVYVGFLGRTTPAGTGPFVAF